MFPFMYPFRLSILVCQKTNIFHFSKNSMPNLSLDILIKYIFIKRKVCRCMQVLFMFISLPPPPVGGATRIYFFLQNAKAGGVHPGKKSLPGGGGGGGGGAALKILSLPSPPPPGDIN